VLAGSNCGCLICALELSLRLEIAETTLKQEYHWLISQNPVLSIFPTALDLVAHLHHHEEQNRNPSPDQVLLRLVDTHRPLTSNLLQPLLLLVFIPTIHRTTSRVVAIFPSVARDDIAQHLIAALLEFLESKELLSRRSYFAFAVARKLRRCAFRWAIRESRAAVADDPPDQMAVKPESCNKNGFHSEILLHQFFDDCQRRGWLTDSERQLIIESKIEGISCPELARRDGHSAIAVRHRIHRLVAKLRRLAGTSGTNGLRQMNLFQK
jgi:DNA-directed RNA polymerase specialized sigma24 family protein